MYSKELLENPNLERLIMLAANYVSHSRKHSEVKSVTDRFGSLPGDLDMDELVYYYRGQMKDMMSHLLELVGHDRDIAMEAIAYAKSQMIDYDDT